MLDFNYYNPTHIVFGRDRMGELDKLIPKNAKVLITYGGESAIKYGTIARVEEALGEREFIRFGGIEPNPQYLTLMKAVEIVKREKVDFLLAVGGGSVMDGSKFIALAVNYQGGTPEELLYDFSRIATIKKALPIGTVLTLPATGSEMNCNAVISHTGGKFFVASPLVYPAFSLLDPSLTFTLPDKQVANGIVDTFIHVVEQYVTYPVDGRFQDRTAEGILQTLIEIGEKTLKDPTDYDTRANLVWCATMALNGLIGAGVPQDWTTHNIGHELTAKFGIDHGRTLAILQPSIWTVLKDQKRAKLLQYAERVWHILEGDEDSRIDEAIVKTRDFFESIGVKTRLSDYGIKFEEIEDIVASLEKHDKKSLSEKGTVTLEVSRRILEEAF